MDLRDMPIIKVELDFVRSQVQALLQRSSEELSNMIEKSFEKAISEYDVDAIVKAQVEYALDKEISQYFTYGNGAKAISQAVENAFKNKE